MLITARLCGLKSLLGHSLVMWSSEYYLFFSFLVWKKNNTRPRRHHILGIGLYSSSFTLLFFLILSRSKMEIWQLRIKAYKNWFPKWMQWSVTETIAYLWGKTSIRDKLYFCNSCGLSWSCNHSPMYYLSLSLVRIIDNILVDFS